MKEYYVYTYLNPFCIEHNLNHGCVTNVAKGKYKAHKGWKCEYLNEDKTCQNP